MQPLLATSMISKSVAIALLSTSLVVPQVALAENPDHTRRLLTEKACAQCDLSNAGLVFADLSQAVLTGANLQGANLSQAKLQGADLRGANLIGVSLFGANLAGARLEGANLTAADLRNAYLAGAVLDGATLNQAVLQGAIGLPTNQGSPQDFYRWATEDVQQKNYPRAVDNFNQAIVRKPDYAEAYMGRSFARFQLGDRPGAIADSKQAEKLFSAQGRTADADVAQKLAKELETPPTNKKGGSRFLQGLMGIVGTLLQLFLL
jgi:uncharacterized protein YjbI with pentapeptide repeats